jgi:myo-inositol-1(or 4)-monophosphatase
MLVKTQYYKDTLIKALKMLDETFETSIIDKERADVLVESYIIKCLKEKCDDFTVISEESGIINIGQNPKITIYLDPLDGTGNFIKGIPIYAISLAVSPHQSSLINLNNVQYSIVVSSLGLTFEAFRGEGFFLNGLKIKRNIKTSSPNTKEISRCFIRCNINNDFNLPTRHIRLLGASSIELGMLAYGSFDAFVDYGTLKLTDLAAPYLILKETGITFSDITGSKSYIFKENDIKKRFSLVAAKTKALHKKILSYIWSTGK